MFYVAWIAVVRLVGQKLFVLVIFGWGVIYFVAGARMTWIAVFLGVIGFSGNFAYHNSEHFARRIDGYLNADVDPRSQIGYATNAIQEGGFFGVGVGNGQVKWTLPDAHTDFIIAVAPCGQKSDSTGNSYPSFSAKTR